MSNLDYLYHACFGIDSNLASTMNEVATTMRYDTYTCLTAFSYYDVKRLRNADSMPMFAFRQWQIDSFPCLMH